MCAAESSKVAAHHVSPSAVGSRERASRQVSARSTSPPRLESSRSTTSWTLTASQRPSGQRSRSATSAHWPARTRAKAGPCSSVMSVDRARDTDSTGSEPSSTGAAGSARSTGSQVSASVGASLTSRSSTVVVGRARSSASGAGPSSPTGLTRVTGPRSVRRYSDDVKPRISRRSASSSLAASRAAPVREPASSAGRAASSSASRERSERNRERGVGVGAVLGSVGFSRASHSLRRSSTRARKDSLVASVVT